MAKALQIKGILANKVFNMCDCGESVTNTETIEKFLCIHRPRGVTLGWLLLSSEPLAQAVIVLPSSFVMFKSQLALHRCI